MDRHYRAPSLVPMDVVVVDVASFTFQFFSIQQLRDCLAYYQQKIRPSSRLSIGGADHWEAQRWFERLPVHLLESSKRKRVVKALNEALSLFESDATR